MSAKKDNCIYINQGLMHKCKQKQIVSFLGKKICHWDLTYIWQTKLE